MKKYIHTITVLFTLFVCSAVAQTGQHAAAAGVSPDPEGDIRAAVESKLSKKNEVKDIYYQDYDGDGRAEAFIISGLKKERKNPYTDRIQNDRTLWFGWIDPNGGVHLEQIRKDVTPESKVLKLQSQRLFCAVTYCETSTPMDVYLVQGNEIKIIFHGDMIKALSGDDFSSVHSTYDFMYDSDLKAKMGHTWKPYFFYYREGKIYQYTGKKISLARFKKYKNSKSALRKYRKYGKVKSIILRSNGMVHLNYQRGKKDSYYKYYWNVTFRIKNGRLKKIRVMEGTYRKALR